MKRVLLAALAVVGMCACQSSKVKITGRFLGSDAKTVYLEEVTPLLQTVIDSVQLDADGAYRFEVKGVKATPSLYNVIFNGERIPLLLAGGDRLTVGALGSVVRNYTVEGSEESMLLREFYQNYAAGVRNLECIVTTYARPELTDQARQDLKRAYTEQYRRIKREQLKFIVEHKSNLAAVYALYQRLSGDPYLFNGESDAIYFRTVADALEERYPETPYLPALRNEITRLSAQATLQTAVTEAGYPDLELSDMYGKKIRLSTVNQDKVVLLDFWSAELGNSNALNAELKQIYEKYAPLDFEIYQVAVDTSKPLWISSVQEQALPWISVSDLKGQASPAFRVYNMRKLPSSFLIDRAGMIVGKDLYGVALEKKLDDLLKK
ncbi:MAG: TlpA disulfide reductase family protein [Alistipes sp.]